MRIQSDHLTIERSQDDREDRRGHAVGIVDDQLEFLLADGLDVERGEELLLVCLGGPFREGDAADLLARCAGEVLAEEQTLDALGLGRGQVLAVGIEEDDVGEVLVGRVAAHVDTAGFLAAAQFMPEQGDGDGAQVEGVHACRDQAAQDRAVHHARDVVGIAAGHHGLAGADECAVRRTQLRAELGVHFDVGEAGHAGVGEELAQPLVFPHQTACEDSAFFDDLLRPELDVGAEPRAAPDPAAVADEDILRDDGLLADGAFGTDDIRGDLGVVTDHHIAPDHGVGDDRTRPDDAVVTDHRVGDLRPFADGAVPADDHTAGELHAREIDACAFADRGVARLHPRDVQVHRSGQDVHVGILVLVQVADVAPVAVRGVAVQSEILPEQEREEVLAEIEILTVGDHLQDCPAR